MHNPTTVTRTQSRRRRASNSTTADIRASIPSLSDRVGTPDDLIVRRTLVRRTPVRFRAKDTAEKTRIVSEAVDEVLVHGDVLVAIGGIDEDGAVGETCGGPGVREGPCFGCGRGDVYDRSLAAFLEEVLAVKGIYPTDICVVDVVRQWADHEGSGGTRVAHACRLSPFFS